MRPSISVDPTNPMNIYAASILDNFIKVRTADAVGRSKRFQVLSSLGRSVSLPTKMAWCITSLSDPEGTNWRSDSILDRMVCQTKDGPNGSFSNGSFTAVNGKKHDKEWGTIHPSKGTIGLSWTQFDSYGTSNPTCKSTILFSESDDAGQTWNTRGDNRTTW